MKYIKIETIRVNFENGVYCDITPDLNDKGYYSFWLYRKGYGVSIDMFGARADSIDEAVAIADANVPDYIDELMEMCGDDN